MKYIMITEFGSTVYGTNIPTSDRDYKAIFVPTARDILLQKAPRTIVEHTKADKHQRNTADDVDMEKFALHQYLNLLMQGQTVALDMLFTPWTFHTQLAEGVWSEIQANKDRFLHRGTTAFVGYARQQAAKYGIKGSRIAAIRATLEYLNQCQKLYGNKTKLQEFFTTYQNLPLTMQNEYTALVLVNGPGGKPEPHLEVCNRKIPFHASVQYAAQIFQKIFDEYGHRALLAEKHEGIDWKSLMHAVRVSCEAKELLSTGHITFPRPEAPLLLKIRKGLLPYKEVAELIEQGLEDLEVLKLSSTLRDTPDYEFANTLIESVYSQEVIQTYDDY